MAGTNWHNLDNIIQNLADVASKKYFVKELVIKFGNTGTPTLNAINTPEYKELHRNITNVTRQGQFQQFMTDYNSTTPATANNALNPLRILVIKINTDSNLDFLDDGNIAGYFTGGAPGAIPADPTTPYPPPNVTTAFGPINIPVKWQVHRSLNIITYNLDGSRNKSDLDNIINNGFLILPKTLILLQGAENYTLTKPANTHLHEIGGTNGFKKLYICAHDKTSGPSGGYNLTDSKHNLYGFTRNEGDKLLWLATYSDEGNYIIVNVQFPADAPGNFPANFGNHVVARLKGDPNFKDRIDDGYAIFIAGDFGCDTPANALTTAGAPNQLNIIGFDTPVGKNTFKPTPPGTGFTDVRDHILFNDKVDRTGLPVNVNVITKSIPAGSAFENIETISTHLPVNIENGIDFYIGQETVTRYIHGPTKGEPKTNPVLTSALKDDGKIGSMLDIMSSQITKMPDTQLRNIVSSSIYNFTRGSMPVVVATPKTPAPAPVATPAPVTPPPAVPTTLPPKKLTSATIGKALTDFNYIGVTKTKYNIYNTTYEKLSTPHYTNINPNISFNGTASAIDSIQWMTYDKANNIFYGQKTDKNKKKGITTATQSFIFMYNTTTNHLSIYNHNTSAFEVMTTT